MAASGASGGSGDGQPPPNEKSSLSLSFGAIKGRAKPRLNISEAEEAQRREAITGIGSRGVVTADGAPAAAGPRVIPKQENSFVVGVGRTDAGGRADGAGTAADGSAAAGDGAGRGVAGRGAAQRGRANGQPAGSGRPRFIPDQDDGTVGTVEDRFAAAEEQAVDTSIAYGLTVAPRRDRPAADGAESANANANAAVEPQHKGHGGGGGGGRGGGVTTRDWESRVFNEDVARLPDEADEAAYDAMPIEEFGAAMLRGMGWSEGQGVGRRKAGPATPFQYVQRPHRLGLGAEPAKPEESSRRHIKPGESREAKKDKVFIDDEGRQRHVMSIDDKLVDRQLLGVHPGKTMHILAGRHEGLTCEVLALEPKVEGRSDRAAVRLVSSGEAIKIRCSELGEKHEADAQKRDKEAAEVEKLERKRERKERARARESDGGGSSGADAKRRRHNDDGGARPDSEPQNQWRRDERGASTATRDSDGAGPSGSNEPAWLLPHIRVRIVDKKLSQGRLYLKKATIADVAQPTVCDVVIDDPRQRVNGVAQHQLETIVPKTNGAMVAFVAGEHRGQRAKLMDRNMKSAAAAVQLLSNFDIVRVAFDDIAEYVGEDEE